MVKPAQDLAFTQQSNDKQGWIIRMQCKTRQLLVISLAALMCGTASAKRLTGDAWVETGVPGGTGTASVNLQSPPTGPAITSINSLSFSPGDGLAWGTGTLGNLSEYYFGGSALAPSEQVILESSGNEVKVIFAYDYSVDSNGLPLPGGFGGLGETAALTVNGVTYTTKPGIAPNSLGGPDFSNGFDMTFADSSAVFDFVNGTLVDSSDIKTAWAVSGSTASAPEIDPSSVTSALTLLMGALVLVRSGKRR
jgi:hypothetical protein